MPQNQSCALGLIEITGLSPALLAIDAMEKSAAVTIAQIEFNDLYGACLKLTGPTAGVQTALAAAKSLLDSLHVSAIAQIIPNPAETIRMSGNPDPNSAP